GTVRKWGLHHLRRAGPRTRLRRRSWRDRRRCLRCRHGQGDNLRDRWRRTRGLAGDRRRLSGLRDGRNLSEARTGHGKQQNRSMHGGNGGDDVNRYEIAGQSVLWLRRANKREAQTGHRARSRSKNEVLRNITFPRSMKNFLPLFAFTISIFVGPIFADDFRSMVVASELRADLHGFNGAHSMWIRISRK